MGIPSGDLCGNARETASTPGRSARAGRPMAGKYLFSLRLEAVRRSVWPRAFGQLHPAIVFVVTMLAGLAAVAGLSIVLGALVTRVLEPAWGIGAADERVNVWLAAHRTTSRTHASLIGSTIAGGVVLPIRRRHARHRLPVVPQVADRGVPRVRAWRRVGVVPSHDARHSFPSSSRCSLGALACQRQLSVRAHGCVGRRVRRSRASAHFEIHEQHVSRVRLGACVGDRCVRGRLPHVPGNAPSAGRRWRDCRRTRGNCRPRLRMSNGRRRRRVARRQPHVNVAVIAHSGKTLGRRTACASSCARGRRNRQAVLV